MTEPGALVDERAARALAERAWAVHLGAGADLADLRERLAGGTLAAAFAATASARPDHLALEIDGAGVSHGELDARAARLGGWLARNGVGAGEAVLVSGRTSLEFVVAYLAVLRCGGVVVLANPDLTAAELGHYREGSGARACLASADVLARMPTDQLDVVVDLSDADVGFPALAEALDGAAIGPAAVAAGDPALLAFTSGTTGAPKAVPLTHANLLASIRGAMWAWRWSADDVLVHSLPLVHQHGLSGVNATLLAGSTALLSSAFDPVGLCRLVAERRATVLFAVPTIYERLLASADAEPRALAGLRLATSGSAALPAGLARRIEEEAGIRPLERYGTTESGLDVSNPYEGERAIGTVGLPLPGVEVAIVAGAAPAEPGEVGEIVLRGPQVFAGYRGAASGEAGSFLPGGWFRTGDLGRIDPETGYLAITGRSKELIISGGMNVFPREVELALERIEGIDAAAVAGAPSERWGEEVVALVVAAAPERFDADAALAALRGALAAYKCPKRLHLVGTIPRSETGKILRAEVAATVREHDAEAAATAAYGKVLDAAGRRLRESGEPPTGPRDPEAPW